MVVTCVMHAGQPQDVVLPTAIPTRHKVALLLVAAAAALLFQLSFLIIFLYG